MENYSRRSFLKYLLGTILVNGCCSTNSLCSLEKSTSNSKKLPIIIDTHAHVFNANDLPIYGFIKKVGLGLYNHQNTGLTDEMKDGLAYMLTEIAHGIGYSATEEYEYLSNPNRESVSFNKTDFDKKLQEKLLQYKVSNDKKEKQIFKILATELKEIQSKKLGTELDINIDQILKSSDSDREFVETLEVMFDLPFFIIRHIEWVSLLTQPRYKITEQLISDFDNKIDLFLGAMVDLDHWVEEPSQVRPTSYIEEQIAVMSIIAKEQQGRIHLFAPFDPWRLVERREMEKQSGEKNALEVVQDAVLNHGFMGVKLYPPMGFSATDNINHKDFPNTSTPEEARAFGKKLDEVLEELFVWCAKHNVPIMAHCNNSNGAGKGYAERAAPSYWESLIKKPQFAKLRINLAHFGGAESLVSNYNKGWALQVGRLMQEYPNIYADVGYHEGVVHGIGKEESYVEKYFSNLHKMTREFPLVKKRLMYGSDWSMIAKEKNYQNYLKDYYEQYCDKFDANEIADMFGLNAVNYLGLPNEDVKARIRNFHGGDGPGWLKCI
ncbi:amidohydrolase family protein [Candidatus Uabimicrobium sp. HlEnr_7]|uniref:amidohydrolase family protein n=1 Tax=Candidatus Uabimicrobium helgolandensis TaxID=3095367 RepID=UPI003556B0CA